MPEYTFSKLSISNYKEKGSSFYAVAHPATSINDVKNKLSTIKEEYPDASHICYAYRIIMGSHLDEFASDSGEPKGSSGQSILNVLKRQKLINSVLFVIRYYGGSKLGIPGLIYAYGITAKIAIENANLIKWQKKKRVLVTYPYKLEGIMKSILRKNQADVILEDFNEKIDIQLKIDVDFFDQFIDSINELSSGSVQVIVKE